MKVIHLITGLTIGGAETMLLRTVPHLTGEHIVCSIIPRGPIGEALEQAGVPVVYMNLKSFTDIRAMKRLWNFLRSEQPDILTTYLLHADIIGRVFGRLARVPIIISSLRCAHRDKPILVQLARWTAPLAVAYLAVSQSVKQWAQARLHIPAQKISVIYNGLTLSDLPNAQARQAARQTLNLPTNTTVLTFIGRLDSQKGIEYLLLAISLLPMHLQNSITVLIAGDGAMRLTLQQQTSQLQLQQCVQFLGFRQDITTLLSATDIFVSPTLFEGISNAIMEAMSFGLPVLSTAIPENQELITSGKNGILVPVRNATALAEQVQHLIDQPAERQRLGSLARQRIVEDFSLATTITQLNNFYRKLCVE